MDPSSPCATDVQNDQSLLPDSGYYSPHDTESQLFNFDETSPISRSTSTPIRQTSSPTSLVLDHTLGSVYGRRAMMRSRRASDPFPRADTSEQLKRSSSESFVVETDQPLAPTDQAAANQPCTSSKNPDPTRPVAVVRPLSPEVAGQPEPEPVAASEELRNATAQIGIRLRQLADEFDRDLDNGGRIIIRVEAPPIGVFLFGAEIVEGLVQVAIGFFLF